MSKSSQKVLPLFNFPTKVVLVDDNVNFVKGMQMLSFHYGVELIPFNEPKKALSFLRDQSYFKSTKSYLTPEENNEIFHGEINLHLNDIHKEIYDAHRFDEVSVLVVDYAMPGMNGQEFCSQIADLPLQKLLLTGEAFFEKSVGIFNADENDKFVKKSDDCGLIFNFIKRLQHKYFEITTEDLIVVLQNSMSVSVFSDPYFVECFEKIINENEIVEYYVVNNSGSYLMLNKDGKVKLLIVKSNEDMRVTEKEMALQSKKWSLHDAKYLKGNKQDYYYALIDVERNSQDFLINFDKIKPYQEHVDSR